MRLIVGLSGKQYSGKDTLADILYTGYLQEHGFVKAHIADALKVLYFDETYDSGYDDSDSVPVEDKVTAVDALKMHVPEVRTRLIELGAEARAKHPDTLLTFALERGNFILIPSIRFKNEIEFYKNNSDFFLPVRLESAESVRAERGVLSNSADPTETELDDYEFPMTIQNDGSIEKLQLEAKYVAHTVFMRMAALYMQRANSVIGSTA